MKVTDTRQRWLGIELGDERIAFSAAEIRVLRRASELLRQIRDLPGLIALAELALPR